MSLAHTLSALIFVWLVLPLSSTYAFPSVEVLAEVGGKDGDTYSSGVETLRKGLAAFEAENYAGAVEALSTAEIKHVSSQDLAAYFLAESLFHTGRFAEASEVLHDFDKRYPFST